MDIPRAREALEDLLKSPASTATSVRYYVKLALSHLQDDNTEANRTIIEQMRRDHEQR